MAWVERPCPCCTYSTDFANWAIPLTYLAIPPTLESLQTVTDRLVQRIQTQIGSQPYALLGHSLGTIIIRNTYPPAQLPSTHSLFFPRPTHGGLSSRQILLQRRPLSATHGRNGAIARPG
ncbi:hypothetical protein [Acaryochloris sp. 'Moss Beach']|uniref:hypothetical protein n=1 Tax=Acaryochloris sp. 'Moss Beach' TaxID=2740837 RepID=UPI001F2940DB|nr:hypothetical protein [Acaryochloris sp. 'Moss Beach']